MISASVVWFDQLKGLGEALTDNGMTVFLRSNEIVPVENMFTGLTKGQEISVELKNFHAIKIVRL